ncbi:hypothetical protein [Psychrobacter sp. K31L]|uniref:hypothetical protein n=1 Tax=Psychrobacter sp. K31L TaxID=2820758 RepID=UPI001B344366|nr:hypothetical protein [Psychrobacter sp. K31L]MBP3945109.1 hypothetical protein [Psychrobacter sp. K31L]
MIFDKTELFYQKINRLGLTIHEIDGWQYGYRLSNHGNESILYERRVNGYTYKATVTLEQLQNEQDNKDHFELVLNTYFSKAYAAHISGSLAKNNSRNGCCINFSNI